MAICSCCGCEYDPAEAERQFDRDRGVKKRGLVGAYVNVDTYCGDCAIQWGCSFYDEGMDALGYDDD